MTIAEIKARDYFFKLHDITVNQKYHKTLPYSFHLDMVAEQAKKFEKYIPVDEPSNSAIWTAIYGHDSIEDARLTRNDIKNHFDELSAELIYLCTEDKGRNRDERKSLRWYSELAENQDAVFVKLCDMIANVKFSLLTNSSMYDTYKKEYWEKVKPNLDMHISTYKDMFDYLERLLIIN